MRIELQYVNYMPKELKVGVLYVSEQFGTAAHLCPCGCGAKVRTPLGPTEWCVEETERGPTLYPSVGNWQLPCRSHYFIDRGRICWAEEWTEEEITAGRSAEQQRRREYLDALYHEEGGILRRIGRWVKLFWDRPS
ncbi:DUF6527 family protein [Citrifermentans bremense]|uniref:DUF6527 family protein n=1 Tax=Citrifermentans bremense TaxID=60035 RepID=UPI000A00C6BB